MSVLANRPVSTKLNAFINGLSFISFFKFITKYVCVNYVCCEFFQDTLSSFWIVTAFQNVPGPVFIILKKCKNKKGFEYNILKHHSLCLF